MKLAAWIGAFIAIGLLALFLGGRDQTMSAAEARAKIVALGDEPNLHLVETKQFEGDAVLGSRIEKKLRDGLGLRKRETPVVIEDYHFRDPSGPFTIQLFDREGQSSEISVYGGPKASTPMGRLLRTTFPKAEFVAKP